METVESVPFKATKSVDRCPETMNFDPIETALLELNPPKFTSGTLRETIGRQELLPFPTAFCNLENPKQDVNYVKSLFCKPGHEQLSI
ncbi:hypothetical protein Ciccas_009327 [Cichlidogyrus casuarinus]|uniref:Uncharacterized protein n=1 Tax=Cichlidogyrus casuarinus TaxID=1844966 RepID=A0ABD2PY12_9PLAT